MVLLIKPFSKYCFLGFLLLLLTLTAHSQSLEDIQNVKVDNLSDAQIEQLIKRAESSGMNEQQLESMAIERGMPAMEAAKLRQRIQALRSGGRDATDTRQVQGKSAREVQGMEDQQDVFDSLRKSDPYYDLTPKQKKIYGYTLFHNKELNFNPSLNIPTPENYIIGTGDQLLIDVYGASQQSYDLEVTPEGRIFIPNVGPVEVGGASVSAARARLKTSLSSIYSGLQGTNPNTFIQVRLGNIRTINVTMAGELRKPGTYSLPSFASVFNALFAAGGPNEDGSFRHIQVYRDNQLVGETDIYQFLRNGTDTGNVRLQDNDVVIVQPLRTRVEIEGPVRRPGLFEIKPDESIEDLIAYAGGYTDQAYTNRLTVRRATGEQMKVEDVGEEDYSDFQPRDGDLYIVGEILNRYENRVQISGAVLRPGEFALTEGMTVKSLIERADGLRGDAFLNRATLYRTNDDFTQEVLTLDVQGIINGTVPDVPLIKEDVINIASKHDIREEYYLQVSGEVNQTGIFPYRESMTVGDLLIRAKGFKESATNSSIEVARRIKDDPSGKIAEIISLQIGRNLELTPADSQIILQPFDHIFVRKSPGFERERLVTVEGEVLYPGEFVLQDNDERISDLLARSGGLNQFAYAEGARLTRRTEFYKELEEAERELENLQALLMEVDKRDEEKMTVNTNAELELIERLERKIELLKEEDRKRKKAARSDEDTLFEDRYAFLDGADTSSAKLELRETELVGIELQKILENPGSKFDLILQEGDIISIPKELQTVRMRGEVLYPTTARYDSNRGFKNYISRAGGFSEDARKSRSYVIYANGDVKRTKKILFFNAFPHVEPGAEIIVPEKPARQGIPPQVWVTIGSGLATMALVITQILNNLN